MKWYNPFSWFKKVVVEEDPIVLPWRSAYCYGINDYDGGSQNDLYGCVNDAKGWASLLTENGYSTYLSLNSEVTKARVLSDLKKIVRYAKAGDRIIFTYSGHGSAVKDWNGDEADGRDETLFVFDGEITDDEIGDILKDLKEFVWLTLIMDSCHSGTVSRGIRSYQPPKKESGAIKEVLLSGCLPDEFCYDANFDGVPAGAFSYFAQKALRENTSLTCHGLWNEVRKSLPSPNYRQTPMIYGEDDNQYRTVL